MPTAFPYEPGPRSGDWLVTLPADARVGEVIVYQGVPSLPAGGARYRFKCDEASLPLEDFNGSALALDTVAAGTLLFSQTSLRSDSAGASVGVSGTTDLFAPWNDSPTVVGSDYAFACLMSHNASSGLSTFGIAGLRGLVGVDMHRTGVGGWEAPRIFTWHGTDWFAAGTVGSFSANDVGVFLAARISAGGAWKFWYDSLTATGTDGSYDPDPTWTLALHSNDGGVFWQELHVWDTFATDADIEAVRLDLMGF